MRDVYAQAIQELVLNEVRPTTFMQEFEKWFNSFELDPFIEMAQEVEDNG